MKLENSITDAITSYRKDVGKLGEVDDWLQALTTSRTSQQSEAEFILRADFLHNRHFNFRRPLTIFLRKQRIEYLKRLLLECSP